jgi:hypothetical protein
MTLCKHKWQTPDFAKKLIEAHPSAYVYLCIKCCEMRLVQLKGQK